jgi:hypothetical protein
MLCSLLGGIMTFQDFLIGVLVLLVGATFCFVGYRFFRILIAVWGFFAGFNLCAAAMTALFGQNFLGTTTTWILGLVVGLVFAVLILVLNLPKAFTALGGAVAVLAGILIMLGQVHVVGLQYGVAVALVKASWFWSIVAIVLAVGGFLAQLRTMQEYTLVWAETQVPGGSSNV